MANAKVEQLKNSLYYNVPGWIDGTRQFYQLIQDNLPEYGIILDVGAGPGNPHYPDLRRPGLKIVGIDIDPAVLNNPFLDEAHVASICHLPFEQNYFDLAIANFVFEHLEDGLTALQEIYRVVKPGGKLIFRTPNIYHYAVLISRLTPQWFHRLVANRVRGLKNEESDVYPTFYRMNTWLGLKRLLASAGFQVETLQAIEKEPSYLMFSPYFFLLGVLYERMVNATEMLKGLRANILGVATKITDRSGSDK